MSKQDGGPAFPTTPVNNGYDHQTTGAGTGSGVGMSIRDYLAAHAPPVPKVAYDGYLECLRTNEPESMEIPWNDHILRCLAFQEARWRWHFADELLSIRERNVRHPSDAP
jgi:hypothetical protein